MTLSVDIDHTQGDFRLKAAFESQGRLTALFGRSGSGKTTLVNAIAGLVRPQRARIFVDGVALVDTGAKIFTPTHRRHVGYVFQEARLFPHMNVRRNLLYGRWFGGRGKGEHGGLDTVVEMLGIGALLDRQPDSLSGGERQRVAIGRALLSEPRLLLMDEPLASLDDARKAEILPYVERLRDEAGVPIVYVSHSMAEVRRLASTLVMLEGGRVVAIGRSEDLLDREPAGGATTLEGRVIDHDPDLGLARVDTPAGVLRIPVQEIAEGAHVRVRINCADAMIAVAKGELVVGALNVLPGVLVSLAPGDGPFEQARVRCGEGEIEVRAPRGFMQRAGVSTGDAVRLVLREASLSPPPSGVS